MLRVLHNPRYAGCFTYGRHRYHQQPGGKMTSRLLPREEWISFIPGVHPGYITLGQYDANRDRLTANAAAHGRDRVTGPPREGTALLQGIIICGRCGGRMTVRYHQRGDQDLPTYVCQRDGIANGHRICTTIPGHSPGERIGTLLIQTLTPLTIEAALTVQAELQHRADEADALRAAHAGRARYHADLARRRYLAAGPPTGSSPVTLEADWNTSLRAQNEAQEAYDNARQQHLRQLTDAQKARIQQLVTDLPAIWNDPLTPARERKRIARLLLTDVTAARTSDTITAHIRLAGGQDHTLRLPIPQSAWELRQTSPQVVAAADELPDHHTHAQIADILNTRGMVSGEGRPFHRLMIMRIRDHYQLRNHEQRLHDRGLLTLHEMAGRLGVSTSTVKSGSTPGLSAASATTTKDRSSTTRPAPTRQPPTTACHGSPTGDLHKHQPPTNQPDEVQYATRGFALGQCAGILSGSMPSLVNTASKRRGSGNRQSPTSAGPAQARDTKIGSSQDRLPHGSQSRAPKDGRCDPRGQHVADLEVQGGAEGI